MDSLFRDYWQLIVGALIAIGGLLINRRKVQIDESAVVLNKWKEFAEAHSVDVKRLREEMAIDRQRYESEIEYLRNRIKEVEAEFVAFRKDSTEQIRERDLRIEGLERRLIQASQSTVTQIGTIKKEVRGLKADKAEEALNTEEHDASGRIDKDSDDIADLQARMDQAGHNSDGRGDGE